MQGASHKETDIATLKEQYIALVNEFNSAHIVAREREEALEIQINRLREADRESHGEIYETRDVLASRLAGIESDLRDATVKAYQQTGEKKFDDNLSVRVTKKFKYDQAKAVEWAETNAPVMIVKSVDKKAFEAMPSVGDLDFVEVDETASAVISGLPKVEK